MQFGQIPNDYPPGTKRYYLVWRTKAGKPYFGPFLVEAGWLWGGEREDDERYLSESSSGCGCCSWSFDFNDQLWYHEVELPDLDVEET